MEFKKFSIFEETRRKQKLEMWNQWVNYKAWDLEWNESKTFFAPWIENIDEVEFVKVSRKNKYDFKYEPLIFQDGKWVSPFEKIENLDDNNEEENGDDTENLDDEEDENLDDEEELTKEQKEEIKASKKFMREFLKLCKEYINAKSEGIKKIKLEIIKEKFNNDVAEELRLADYYGMGKEFIKLYKD